MFGNAETAGTGVVEEVADLITIRSQICVQDLDESLVSDITCGTADAGAQGGFRIFQNFCPSAHDADLQTHLQQALCQGIAQAGAAAGDNGNVFHSRVLRW